MTADAPLAYFLQRIGGQRWFSKDTEIESGCGISPIEYRERSFVNSLQWVIGLEWFLSVENPWQVALTTDHPNGGSFLAYPQIIRLLMDHSYRRERLAEVHPRVLRHSALEDMDRQYTLNEIAIITRAAPARILGLAQKGHLGPGADADITVYVPSKDYEYMFSLPELVIKGGHVLVENFEPRQTISGKTIAVDPGYDADRNRQIENWLDNHYSIRSAHFGVNRALHPRIQIKGDAC
jgi:formylmethanofuran dehydrogenase subunit A